MILRILQFLKIPRLAVSMERRQQDQRRIDWWRDTYRKMILRGESLSDEDRRTAEDLGLDVDELASEHRRVMAGRRWIAIGLDLARVKLNDEGRPVENQYLE